MFFLKFCNWCPLNSRKQIKCALYTDFDCVRQFFFLTETLFSRSHKAIYVSLIIVDLVQLHINKINTNPIIATSLY